MKSKRFFKKALSVCMAALVSASTVFPVYAADMSEVDPVAETEVTQEQSEDKEADVQNTAESETDSLEVTKEDSVDDTNAGLYAICLPKSDDFEYTYDESRLDADLSEEVSMYVLVYEENEKVDMSVKTDKDFSIIDAHSGNVFLSSEDITDGKMSFDMPSTDLLLEAKEEPEQSEVQTETETESQPAVESEGEPQIESESFAETETQADAEIQSESQEETELESEAQSETESETEVSHDEVDSEIYYPEKGSTVTVAPQNVYYKDKTFDVKTYVPETDFINDADIAWEKGEINFDEQGTYDIVYKATLKNDESYSWYIDVPMEVIVEREAATATSDGFEDKIFLNKEQSSDFTGKVPEKNGDHVAGPDVETVKGENFSLSDVNLGYDMNLFAYSVYDDGGFDSNVAGTYNVVYQVLAWQDVEVAFYVDCKVTVKDSIANEEAMTVHIVNTELKATSTDIDGNSYESSYGSDSVTDKNLKSIVVKPAWQNTPDIEPVVTVQKNGEEVSKEGIIISEKKDGDNYDIELNSSLETGKDKYVFVIDWPSYDPTNGGQCQKTEDRRSEDYVDPVEDIIEEDEISDDSGIATYAASKSAAKSYTKTFSGVSYMASLTEQSNWCTGYGWVSKFSGFRRAKMNLSKTFQQRLDAWVTSKGADFTGKIPKYVYIQCAEGNGQHLPWHGKNCSSLSIKATLKVNKSGKPYKLVLTVTAPGASDSQGNYQTFTGSRSVPLEPNDGNVTIVKTSYGKFTMTFTGVNIITAFGIYNDAACTDLEEKVYISPSDENANTAKATVEGLDAGKYWVKEIGIADGHMANRNAYPITVESSKTSTVTIGNTPYVFNGRFVHKVDKNTNAPLANAVFEVTGTYNNENIGKWYFRTDSNGDISYDAAHYLASWNGNTSSKLVEYGDSGIAYGLPEGTTVNVKEVEAPAKYHMDGTWHSTKLNVQSVDNKYLTCDVINLANEPDEGKLQIQKEDSTFGTSVPNTEHYSLAGAKFNVTDKSGNVVATLTTNEKGVTEEVTLPTGDYSVVETENPHGYKMNEKAENVTVSFNKTATVTIKDEPESGSLDLHKKLDPEESDAIKQNRDLTKITFRLSYKTSDGKTVYAKDANGSSMLHPDKDGNLHVDGLYFGTWTLTELDTVEYHQVMDPVQIEVTEDDTEGIDYEVENLRYNDRLIIQKQDIDTGVTIPRAGCTFQIKDEVGEIVSLKVEGNSERSDAFVTDNAGQVEFDEKIPAGKYTLVELTPPEGYRLADPVEFELTGTEKDSVATVVMKDKRVTTGISLEKKDAASGNSAGAGFTFNVIADENITDAAGTTYEGFEAGAVVDTLTTGEDGTAKSNVALYPGRYHIEETGVAANYNKDAENAAFEVVEKQTDDGWAAEVKDFDNGLISVKDTPVMRPIQVTKTDADSQNAAGADFTFTITADKVVDGTGHDYEGFEHGTVVDTITTDGIGIATSKDLYCGTYIIKETVRKQNYVLSTKEYPVTVSDENKTTEPVKVSISDQPLKKKIQVTKIDKVTGNHCGAGYQFQITAAEDILDGTGNVYEGYKAGDVVDTITTGEDGIAVSKELYMGSYNIQEIGVSADGGMSINETKYPFTLKDEKKDGKLEDIKDTDEVMVLPITDIADTPTTLKIKKVDALQDKDGNPILDENGKVKEDEKGNQPDPKSLEGIIFRVKAKDAADSDDQLYTTDKDGNIKVQYLKKNTTYTVKEYKTIPGYNLSDEVKEFTVDDKGQIEGSDIKELTFTNVPNQVAISKTDITNGNELPGAEMQLTDMDGNVLYSWTSGDKPYMIYGLPDGQYRLVEKAAPAVKDADGNLIIKTVDENGNEIHQYELATSVTQSEKEGEDVDGLNSEGIFTVKDSLVVQKVTMKDSPYRWVDLSKKTITGDDELPGCTLTVRDAQGDVVDTWVSTTEAHRIQLHSGVYTLTEEKPADGYVTADTIRFEVKQTSDTDYEVQTVTMRDDVTKITVSKKDITNGEELPGAHLVIKNEKGDVVEEWTSTNETHYIEKLPIGKYTLTEITAPDGYETAETISFEIKDTGEIQHYEMFDSPYRPVEVSKKDITSKDELPGAKLEIRDKDNNVVDSWTSTSEAHKVDLPHGKYTLVETKPADGFTTAESIQFEVLERNTKEDNGVEVQHVEMEDDVTKVQISKQDVTTKKELPGAKLQIKDKDGKVIEEWTSTDEVHYIEKLPIGEYTLVETTAPNGYDVAENVDFKVLDTNEIQHVIMYDSPSVTPGGGTNTPKTGDINPAIPVAAGVAVVVLAGLGIFLFKGKKKKLNK